MRFGSVSFYKRLILSCIIIMIIIPTGLCIYFVMKNNQLSEELQAVSEIDSRFVLEEQWLASSNQTIFSNIDDNVCEYTLDYQKLYPDMYVDRNVDMQEDIPNSVFLTFDDGPSPITPKILKILKEKDVKATFFVIYNDKPASAELLKQMIDEGHTIGVHSTSHEYNHIYSSVEIYLKDFEKTANWIEEVTGKKPEIFRFPGGSINIYNENIYQPIIAEMLRRGYVYYDWNVISGDAAGTCSKLSMYNNVIRGASVKDKAIVLMHDSANKLNTLKALPDIIDSLKASNKILLPLNNTVKPITFCYNN